MCFVACVVFSAPGKGQICCWNWTSTSQGRKKPTKATKETNQEVEPVTNVFNIPDDSDPLSEQYKNWLRSIPTASVNELVQTATRVGGKKIPRKNRRKSKKSKRKTNKSKKSKRKTRKTR